MTKKCDFGDTIVPLGIDDDGGLHDIRHHSDHSISSGIVREVKEGRPIHGELIHAQRSEEHPSVLNVKTSYKNETSGPPKVTSDEFRKNWAKTFNG